MNRAEEKLANTGCFLLDMDGTIYLGEKLLPGALRFLDLLRKENIRYLFLTNNSSKSGVQYARKLKHLGIEAVPEDVFTSGEATAIYLHKLNPGARIYLVGTADLAEEMLRHGFTLSEGEIDFVVLGFDTSLTYEKLVKLCDYVRAGKPYIATHPDLNCPVEKGFIPDIGSMMALVKASTGREPDIIIGKPNHAIVDAIVEKTGIPASRLAMVGDRLYTDIAMGKTGMTTVLVLSGESTKEDLEKSPFQPDYVMRDVGELADVLASLRR